MVISLSHMTWEVSKINRLVRLSIYEFVPMYCLACTISYKSYKYCQAQGPTPGPTQGRVKVKVKAWSWSGHGQVMVRSCQNLTLTLAPTPTQKSTKKWDLTELYTKIGFYSLPPPPPIPSLNECLVNFVTLCDTLKCFLWGHHDSFEMFKILQH